MVKKSLSNALSFGIQTAKEEESKTYNLVVSESKATHNCNEKYPFVESPVENLYCKCGVDRTLFPASAEMIKQKKQKDFASCREAKKLSKSK